jgi:hypothetical protein
MYQGDTVTAFLNGKVEKKLYVKQPTIYEQHSPTGEVLVYRLFKTLYKLKQAPRVWIKKANKILKALELEPIPTNKAYFITPDKKLICSIYVNDFQYFSSNQSRIEKLEQLLNENFKIKSYGHISHYLRIDIDYYQLKGVCHLSQAKYIRQIVKKYDYTHIKVYKTPMAVDAYLTAKTEHQATAQKVH